jgi:hypothetical protein
MSKCLKGIPFYNDKVKDPGQQFIINKVLDEDEKIGKAKPKSEPEAKGFGEVADARALNREEARDSLMFYPNRRTRYHTPASKITVEASKKVGGFINKLNSILRFNIKGGKYKYQEDTKFYPPKATNEEFDEAESYREKLWGSFDSDLNIDTLNEKVFPVILSWVNIVNNISSRLKIPAIRTVRNTTADSQREAPSLAASMGDGTMSISSLHFNKLFEAGNELTEAQLKRLDRIEARIKELSNESAQIDSTGGYSFAHYIEMSELRDEHSKIAVFKKFDTISTVTAYKRLRTQPNGVADFYDTAEQRVKAIMYHEFGHHIHQQYGVTNKKKLISPDIEQLLLWWRTRFDVRHLTKYSEVHRGRSVLTEWFAENHAYWSMDKYEGIAPLGKSEKVLDPFFIFLMGMMEKGIGTQPYGSRELNKNGLRQQYVHEQIMQAVDEYIEGITYE